MLLPRSTAAADFPTSMSISHVQRLPPELLAHVFLLSIYIDSDYPVARAVLLPSHVNQYWRDVALSTPTMWSHISVDVDQWQQEYDRCKVWLARASLCPLSITIIGEPRDDSDGYSSGEQMVLDLLLGHFEQWQHLTLDMPHDALSWLTAIKENIPLLHSLYIPSYYNPAPSSPSSFNVIFHSAPNLRHFRLDELDMNFILQLQVPWGQLTLLQLGACSYQDFLSILTRCPILEHLTVFIEDRTVHLAGTTQITDPVSHSIIRHTKLTNLHVASSVDLSSFFSHLSFPSLRDLTLVIHRSWVQQSFNSFLYRSSCSLRKLSINIPHASTDNIACILRRTPDLTELDLFHKVTRETLQLLLVSGSASAQILVPRLKCLSVKSNSEAGGLVFASVIRSRWRLPLGMTDLDGPSVSRIERIVYHEILVSPARVIISKLAAEGLDVTRTKRPLPNKRVL